MNSLQIRMNSFQIRMNSFHIKLSKLAILPFSFCFLWQLPLGNSILYLGTFDQLLLSCFYCCSAVIRFLIAFYPRAGPADPADWGGPILEQYAVLDNVWSCFCSHLLSRDYYGSMGLTEEQLKSAIFVTKPGAGADITKIQWMFYTLINIHIILLHK